MAYLQELCGSAKALEQRLSDLQAQSALLSDLVAHELAGLDASQHLLVEAVLAEPREFVRVQMVYQLVSGVAGEGAGSYRAIARALSQLRLYPAALQWELGVGSGWSLYRSGQVLACRRSSDATENVTQYASVGRGEGAARVQGLVELLVDGPWLAHMEPLPMHVEREGADAAGSRQGAGFWGGEGGWGEGRGAEGGDMEVVLNNVVRGSKVVVRTRRQGDRFHAPWRVSSIKLKDFLRGQKVPLHLRDNLPIIIVNPPSSPPLRIAEAAAPESGLAGIVQNWQPKSSAGKTFSKVL
jgi:tRNA(Ile)-lysidine synthetase-like protein